MRKFEKQFLAEIFILARVESGLGQVQFAKKLGCSQSYLSKIESGRIVPIVPVLFNALRMSASGRAHLRSLLARISTA